MPSPQFNAQTRQPRQILFTIWAATVMGLVIFGVVGYVVTTMAETRASAPMMPVIFVLGLAGVCAGLASLIIDTVVLGDNQILAALEEAGRDPDEELKLEERALRVLVPARLRQLVIRNGLAEVPGVFGLVITIMHRDWRYLFGALGFSIALVLLNTPNYDALEARIRRVARDRP